MDLSQSGKWLTLNYPYIVIVCAFLFMNFFSLRTLTTQPRFWYDEGLNVELARNFSEVGVLDVVAAPHIFTGDGALLGSTGYPITVPLAAWYRLFGFSLAQSRLYMLLWMNICLIGIFLFARKQWGAAVAAATTIFFVTYPPFYGNGRSVMGEVPGFVFLLLALWSHIEKRNLVLSGVFAGLSAVSKASVYAFILPVFAALCLIDVYGKPQAFKSALKNISIVALSSCLALTPWIIIYYHELVAGGTISSIGEHFANPFASGGYSVSSNILINIKTFFLTGTLVYMTMIAASATVAAYLSHEFRSKNHILLVFVLLFAPFALYYYLKSLGYLRYLITLQLLLLLLIAPTLVSLSSSVSRWIGEWRSKVLLVAFLGGLMLFQTVYLFTNAKLYSGNDPVLAVAFVERQFPDAMYGVVNVPTIASLLPSDKKYDYIDTFGIQTGFDFKTLPQTQLPQIVFAYTDITPSYSEVLDKYYDPVTGGPENVPIYKLKSLPQH